MSIRESAWRGIEGMDVFTTDEEQIGVIEGVLAAGSDANQRYLRVRAGALGDLLGADTLFVPDQDVLAIEADRVILDTTADALARPDWVTPPAKASELEA